MYSGRRSLCAVLVWAALSCPLGTHAQPQGEAPANYPAKPIRILSSSIQGGGTDILARVVAQALNERWGRPAIVDNRPGASGIIAMDLARQATPDGYTLLVTAGSLMSSAMAFKRVPYDVRTELAPVAQLTSQPYLMVVHPSLPVKSIKDLIAYAKSKPGALNYASTGLGSASHLGTEMFNAAVGVRMVHVPYKSGGQALVELLGGRDEMIFLSSVISAAPHVKSGKLRAIAVSSTQRLRAYPDLPTIDEGGVKGFELTNWYGCFAPRSTATGIVVTLNRVIREYMNSAESKSRLDAEGAEPARAISPEEFRQAVVIEVTKWEKFVKTSGLTL